MTKWRGIQTTQEAKNEIVFKTVKNPRGQKTISLPRIDDQKRWAGYPGLTGVSKGLAKIIDSLPPFVTYVEPFAGTAKVFQVLSNLNHYNNVLNDASLKVSQWLLKEFSSPYCQVTNMDFTQCINQWDDEDTVFLIDQPWYKSYYDQVFSCFNRESVKQYDEQVLKICAEIKGKFIITTRKENKRMLNSGFTNAKIKSDYCVCGKYPEVLITTNIPKDYIR